MQPQYLSSAPKLRSVVALSLTPAAVAPDEPAPASPAVDTAACHCCLQGGVVYSLVRGGTPACGRCLALHCRVAGCTAPQPAAAPEGVALSTVLRDPAATAAQSPQCQSAQSAYHRATRGASGQAGRGRWPPARDLILFPGAGAGQAARGRERCRKFSR